MNYIIVLTNSITIQRNIELAGMIKPEPDINKVQTMHKLRTI